MEENNEQSKTMTYVGGTIIAVLLIGLIIAIVLGVRTRKNLNTEKLNSEKLLSEKLQVQKELDSVNADFTALKQKNAEDNKLLEESNKKLAESQRRVSYLSGQNRSLQQTKKDYEDLQKVKAEIQAESDKLKADYDKLMTKSNNLQASLSEMEAKNDRLNAKLDSVQLYRADNYLPTATRGKKDKVVICSSRAKKLNVSFDVPGNLTETLDFTITTPSGSTITPDNKSLSWYYVNDARDFTASLSAVPAEIDNARQVVLSWAVTEKLTRGEYQIHVLCKGNEIGNCRIQLR
jgi:myosin heavy subunit